MAYESGANRVRLKKVFSKVAILISGIELVQKIKKGQFDLTTLEQGKQIPVHQMWKTVLAA